MKYYFLRLLALFAFIIVLMQGCQARYSNPTDTFPPQTIPQATITTSPTGTPFDPVTLEPGDYFDRIRVICWNGYRVFVSEDDVQASPSIFAIRDERC